LNYEKVRATTLAKQLFEYNNLAVPVFNKLLWLENSEAVSIGAWGLGQIKSHESVDTLIDKFRNEEGRGRLGSLYILEALGEIGGQQANQFLEGMLSQSNGIEINAAMILYKHGNNQKAEEALLNANNKQGAIEAIHLLPNMWKNRRNDVIQACIAVLKNPKVSDMNQISAITSASDILVKTKYEKASDVLSDAFDVQKNEMARYNIIKSLGKIGDSKARGFLMSIREDKNKEVSPWMKEKVKEVLGER
jgi:HEAT repeat protein